MNKLALGFAFLISCFCGAVSADTTDSQQPIQIFADQFDGDEVRQVAVYTGNVAVHQGTLEIRGHKLVLSVDQKGYRRAIMTAAKNKLVKFKQRRDPKTAGVEEWMHGQGERLTYDEKTNSLILTSNAQVTRRQNGKKMDESNGAKIIYRLTDSTAMIDGNKNKGSSGRVSTIIAPRNEPTQDDSRRNAIILQPNRNVQK